MLPSNYPPFQDKWLNFEKYKSLHTPPHQKKILINTVDSFSGLLLRETFKCEHKVLFHLYRILSASVNFKGVYVKWNTNMMRILFFKVFLNVVNILQLLISCTYIIFLKNWTGSLLFIILQTMSPLNSSLILFSVKWNCLITSILVHMLIYRIRGDRAGQLSTDSIKTILILGKTGVRLY